MILCISYADEKFRPWQKIQTQTAYHFGADAVREYSPADLDPDFREKNKFILDQPRGAGYWLWKPYIIKDALSSVEDGDFVFYLDSGIMYINKIQYLTETMDREKVNIMVFGQHMAAPEKVWAKRDAFLLMDCDREDFAESGTSDGGVMLFRKGRETEEFVEDFLKYAQDSRIITDIPNQLGKENYPGFKENRHDQTVLGLLAKKKGLKFFKFPDRTGFLFPEQNFPKEVLERSPYPQIVHRHRRNIPLGKTLEEYLQMYSVEPTLRDGILSAKFLLQEGMAREAYDLLCRLLKKYSSASDSEWVSIWHDVIKICSLHSELGSPYAEIFQPLLCKILFQIMRRSMSIYEISSLIMAARSMENKNLLPQEFRDGVLNIVVSYIQQSRKFQFPPYMKTEEEIWNDYQSLNFPETPLYKSALQYLGRGGGID